MSQGGNERADAGVIALIQPQPQRPTQGEEVALIVLPGIQETRQRLRDTLLVKEGDSPVVAGRGEGNTIQCPDDTREIIGLQVQLADIELFHLRAGRPRPVGLFQQRIRVCDVRERTSGQSTQVPYLVRDPIGQEQMMAREGKPKQGFQRPRTPRPTFRPMKCGQGRRGATLTPLQGLQQQMVGAAVIGKPLDQDLCPLDRPLVDRP